MNTTPIRHAATAVAALVALGGCAAASVQSAPAVDRSTAPAPGPTPTYDFPEIAQHTLSNGLQVWLVERPGVPTVTVQLITDAGAVADPADRPGVASLTAAMLTEGTARRSASEIAEEIDFLAANLNAGAGQEVASVSLTTLARNLEAGLDIFADVVVNPAFSAEEWGRVRAQRLAALAQAADQPASVATREFARLVYGTDHPLGRPVQGTPESVAAITPAELRAFHAARYRPGSSHLIVVGDVASGTLLPRLEAAFAGWTGAGAEPVRVAGDPPALGPTRIYLIDKPGAAQSQIRIGHVGVERASRDYFPLLVMNSILGGQFTSRINLNLREDKGYTYGARSDFQMGRLAGPFVASAGVQTAVTKESVIEFLRELQDVRESRPVTEEEVEFARTSIIRREPLTLETNAQIAGRIQDLVLFDLPLDYFDDYNPRVAAVTAAEVNRVAREYLQPERLAIVVVGDRSAIEAGLRELPYPVEIVTAAVEAEEEK